jgi:hypothetical protein
LLGSGFDYHTFHKAIFTTQHGFEIVTANHITCFDNHRLLLFTYYATIIAFWQLLVNLGCRRPIKAPAQGRRIQVKQFSYLTAHAVVITITPNCGAEQALASFTTAVCSVDVHGVILFHAHSWLLAM